MNEIYNENINIIDENKQKLSEYYKDLKDFNLLKDNQIINQGNIAQFINPNSTKKIIHIDLKKNSNNDYRKAIKNIILNLYLELSYKSILYNICVLSEEIKNNYILNTEEKITINSFLTEKYNNQIKKLKIFENSSITKIYDVISSHIQKSDNSKDNLLTNFNEETLMFFNFIIKNILIGLHSLDTVEVIMKNCYPKSKDIKKQLKSFVNKIEHIIKSNILDELMNNHLNNLCFSLNQKINSSIRKDKLLSSYEMKKHLANNNISISEKKAQLLYNEILKKFKTDEDFKLSFIELQELSNLFH